MSTKLKFFAVVAVGLFIAYKLTIGAQRHADLH